jgi:GDP/UDP-N,N'-diacetylbacillosamine 2-epimerase (hydrolysing)
MVFTDLCLELPEFGMTVADIRTDGFPIIAEINTLTIEDTKQSTAAFVGRTTIEFSLLLKRVQPDVILILGDRGEQLAAAIAATYLTIPIAQLHAGEHSGSVDEPVRHAISQLATIHFTATAPYADNVHAMLGGRARHVHVVGAPALDTIATMSVVPKAELFSSMGFDPSKPLLLFVQHPDTSDSRSCDEQLGPSLEALQSFNGNILCFGSNADAGGIAMNDVLQSFVTQGDNRRFVISVSHTTFLSWMACADVLMGNSSSGIIEAASFHLPVINIGDRQQSRLQSGNVLNVSYDTDEIAEAIQQIVFDPSLRQRVQSCENVYGNGTASMAIAEILSQFSQ